MEDQMPFSRGKQLLEMSRSEHEEADTDDTVDEPAAKKQKRVTTSDQKKTRDRQNHPLLDPCNTECKRGCTHNISEIRRRDIWQSYWDLTYDERKNWVYQRVDRVGKKRSTKGEHISRRDLTYTYTLNDTEGTRHTVCKTFFLTTLGYNKNNDKAITTALRNPLDTVIPIGDRRGHKQPANKINRSVIREHVESFNPCVSHYRREHAPLSRYLPSDINKSSIYHDFKDKHPSFKCGYDVYRSEVRNMKISFVKLGEEGCEVCDEFHMNLLSHNHTVQVDKLQALIDCDAEQGAVELKCEKCKCWVQHLRAAKTSRMHYQTDAGPDIPDDTTVRSVDLQKVIMLPRMPGIKTAIFTRRIIAFHETFASVDKKDPQRGKKHHIAVIWHEAIAGRKQEEIASTFVKAIERDRDVCHAVFWLDNCAAQNNKNSATEAASHMR